MTFLRTWRLKRDLSRRLRTRKLVREAEAQRARDAHSRQWKRRGELCRQVLGQREP